VVPRPRLDWTGQLDPRRADRRDVADHGALRPATARVRDGAALWGDERHVRDVFAPHDVALSFEHESNLFAFDGDDVYQTFLEQRYSATWRSSG
jgi:hypothetical protein